MADARPIKILHADGSNLSTWLKRFPKVAKRARVWQHIEQKQTPPTDVAALEAFEQKEDDAIDLIYSWIDDKLLGKIKDEWTAFQIYQHLQMGTGNRRIRICSLLTESTKLTLVDGRPETIAKFLDEWRRIDAELASRGKKRDDFEMLVSVLMKLPSDMENLRTLYFDKIKQWDSEGDAVTTEDIIESLMMESTARSEKEKASDISEEANNAMLKTMEKRHKLGCAECGKPGHSKETCFRIVPCKKCGKKGHSPRFCREEEGNYGEEENKVDMPYYPKRKKEFAYTATLPTPTRGTWIYDSGATSHMTGDRMAYITYQHLKSDKVVTGLNGSAQAIGIGDVLVRIYDGSNYVPLKLTGVLHIPGSHRGLVSGSKLEDAGIRLEGPDNGRVRFITKRTGMCIGQASRRGSLYFLDQNGLTKEFKEKYSHMGYHGETAESENSAKWHRRLAHCGDHVLGPIVSNSLLRTIHMARGKSKDCSHCLAGKAHRRPVPKVAVKATEILMEIHMDTYSPLYATTGGNKYLVMYTDAFSNFTAGFLQKTKSADETLQNFTTFKREIENFTGKRIRTLHGDNGTEFINRKFEDFCVESGIRRTDSTPYVHEQNGIAERKNRTISGMAIAMINEADVNISWWGEAFLTAIYVVNRLPVARLEGRTPHEVMSGRMPSIDHLRVWGCLAHVTLSEERRKEVYRGIKGKKLLPKTQAGRFVGYDVRAKCYRILIKGKIVRSRDVTFIEDVFEIPKETPQIDTYWEKDIPLDKLFGSPMGDPDTELLPEEVESAASMVASSEHAESEGLGIGEQPEGSSTLQDETEIAERSITPDNPVVQPMDRVPPAPRRGTRDRRPPEPYWELKQPIFEPHEEALLALTDPPRVPTSWAEIQTSPEKDEWLIAIQAEYESLVTNNVFELVALPPGRNAIGTKLVLTNKLDSEGNLIRRKARLVVKGFREIYGIDYTDTFAPTAKFTTV